MTFLSLLIWFSQCLLVFSMFILVLGFFLGFLLSGFSAKFMICLGCFEYE